MEKEINDAFKDVYASRASKDEVGVVRIFVISIIFALLGAGGLGVYVNSNMGERISVVETRIGSFEARQQENNEILKEIEHLLREGHATH